MKLPSIAQVHLDTFVINVSIALKFEDFKQWDYPYSKEWRYYGRYTEYNVDNLLQATLLNGASEEKYNILVKINEAKTPTEFTDNIKELMEYYTDQWFYARYVESYFTHTKANYNDWKRIMRPDATLPIIASTNDMTFTLNEQFEQLTPNEQKREVDYYWQQVEQVRQAVLLDWSKEIDKIKTPVRVYGETQQLLEVQEDIKKAQYDDNAIHLPGIERTVSNYLKSPIIQPVLDEIMLSKAFLASLTSVQIDYLAIDYTKELAYLEKDAKRFYFEQADVVEKVTLLQQQRDRYKQRLQNM